MNDKQPYLLLKPCSFDSLSQKPKMKICIQKFVSHNFPLHTYIYIPILKHMGLQYFLFILFEQQLTWGKKSSIYCSTPQVTAMVPVLKSGISELHLSSPWVTRTQYFSHHLLPCTKYIKRVHKQQARIRRWTWHAGTLTNDLTNSLDD